MKLFKCQNCELILFFENRNCTRCGHLLGYLPVENELSALKPAGGDLWEPMAIPGARSRFCANAQYDACNWLVPAESPERFCIACRHNRTVPDLSAPENMEQWRKMELAKHRLFYTLLRLHLPLPNRNDNPETGLAFDFLADPPDDDKRVLTGHDEGIITLALTEADDAERESRRTKMHEPYRTLLGHFRHEIGHYYWDRLIRDPQRQDESRAMFGDDRMDYAEALKRHYNKGAPANWQENFVSTYATSHPWEDFAETWAHYLHIIDSLDTSSAYGIEVHPSIASGELHASATINPYEPGNFEHLIDIWLPLTYAMNAMNRSMGLNDIYPFVLSPQVIAKLTFIHQLVHSHNQQMPMPEGKAA